MENDMESMGAQLGSANDNEIEKEAAITSYKQQLGTC